MLRSAGSAQAELDDVDLVGYGAVMERVAANLRDFCADVLRGDWSVREAAQMLAASNTRAMTQAASRVGRLC